MDLKDVTAAILAGGLGTRLAPLLPGQQKVMVKVRQHPFLEYILHQLSRAGFKNVVICTCYLDEQVQGVFGDSYRNLSLSYSNEKSPLGTAGAIRNALPRFNSQNVLVVNGDSFYDSNLQRFYDFHLEKRARGSILLTEVDDTSRYGKVDIDENGQITAFEEKRARGGAGFINGGIYLFSRSLLPEIPENKIVSLEKEMFPGWIGKDFYGFKGQGKFVDIGTSESLKKAEEFFSQYPI